MQRTLTRTIAIGYILLFLITPLILTPWNYELFEFNKMLFVYLITIGVATLFLARTVLEKRITLVRTPLDIPLFLFLAVQLISTIFSIDPHISIWGYYGRFNGGLISTICYLVLYYVLVNTFIYDSENSNPKKPPKVLKRVHVFFRTLFAYDATKHLQKTAEGAGLVVWILWASLITGTIVASYGVAQHFGIDAHLWVQDVQNRIFSTLGQPNWLGAYMCILIMIAIAYAAVPLLTKRLSSGSYTWLKHIGLVAISVLFYTTLLYTKSRSGLIAFWIVFTSVLVFCAGVFFYLKRSASIQKKGISKALLLSAATVCIALVITTAHVGTMYTPSYTNSLLKQTPQEEAPFTGSDAREEIEQAPLNITESGDIRKLVWHGALDATFERPIIGWGPETFAWVYYRFRPTEHNVTSEWDFLYNKAHNEYLNMAATSGLVGLFSYLLIIVVFLVYGGFGIFRYVRGRLLERTGTLEQKEASLSVNRMMLSTGLYASWLTILITNFFGFSVVVISIYFWLIPAMIWLLFNHHSSVPYYEYHLRFFDSKNSYLSKKVDTFIKKNLNTSARITLSQWAALALVAFVGFFFVFSVGKMWWADYHFAEGKSYARKGNYGLAYQEYYKAIKLRPYEPLYYNELSTTLSVLTSEQYRSDTLTGDKLPNKDDYKEATSRALAASNYALEFSPYNVSFWKARTRMFYNLAEIDPEYAQQALSSLERAGELAPTDAKIVYNTGIIYEAIGRQDDAIERFEYALSIKPNYKDAALALAIFYELDDNQAEANYWYRYILDNIDPTDQTAREKLSE